MKDSIQTWDYFERKKINIVTDDIVIAYGYKPNVIAWKSEVSCKSEHKNEER